MYRYGLILWNEKTDEEIRLWTEDRNYFSAEDRVKTYNLPNGFEAGTLHFLEENQYHLYGQRLEEILLSQ